MNAFRSLHPAAPPPLQAQPTRSRFVTALGWCMTLVSALGCIVSVASLLMVLAGSHGTANANLLEGFVVIGVPPLTLIAGVGLVRRWSWALGYSIFLFGSVAAWNIARMLRGPTPQHTYTSPGGVPTTVLASDVNYLAHLVVVTVSLGLLAKLLTKSVRAEFRRTPWPVLASATPAPGMASGASIHGVAVTDRIAPTQSGVARDHIGERSGTDRDRGWRIGHQGRDDMFYEEWRNGGWQRIRISGEMLMGRAHHVIHFASPEAWLNHPEWARHRRDEIISRIMSVFGAPDYEYQVDGIDRTSPRPAVGPAAATPARASLPCSAAPAAPRSGSIALFAAIAFLFAITGVMGWLVLGGVKTGETYFPTKSSSLRRSVIRAEEPVMYWASIGIYSVVGVGTFGLGAWGIREAFRVRHRRFRCKSVARMSAN